MICRRPKVRRRRCRAFSLIELTVASLIVAAVAIFFVIPQYARYARAREVGDAAATLVQDIAFLERFAQNSNPYEGATIEVQSDYPFRYTCYSGRPSGMDPQSHIRGVLIERSFPNVMLASGPLRHNSPFLFAHNGSIQFVANQQWNDQHIPVTIGLQSLVDDERTATVSVNPFTGAVATP